MDEDVRKELESLKCMIVAWKESYIKRAYEEGEGCAYLLREYVGEIDEMVYPYVYKIYKLGGMEREDLDSFMDFCQAQAIEFLEVLNEMHQKEDKHA